MTGTTWLVLIFVVGWLIAGAAGALHLWRHGHRDPLWWLLGLLLGPLFLVIAWDRASRHSAPVVRRVNSTAGERPGGRSVLVAVDGSAESDQAVRDTAAVLGDVLGRVLLATVVSVESLERRDAADEQRARELLDSRASWLPATAGVESHVVAGQPGQALLELAAAEDVDAIAVGRRGHGLSRAVLGSVAAQVTAHAPIPVLVAGPPARGPQATVGPRDQR